MTPAVRPAAVAGSWYPGRPGALAAAIDALASAARDAGVAGEDAPAPSAPLRAIVVPHAGLRYSGAVGAVAFAAAGGRHYRSVVLVGPSHFVAFEGVSSWPSGAWETPLGPVAVDASLADAIAAESPVIVSRPAAHAREHSLEMQLPFLARLMPGVPIVPLVLGEQNRATVSALGSALARAVQQSESADRSRPASPDSDGPTVLLVASSDLSHYEDAPTAFALDRVVMACVDAFDPAGLMDALERNPRHACGGGAVVAVLAAASALGARRARVLRYADSGDVSGDKSSVVGYMAAAVW